MPAQPTSANRSRHVLAAARAGALFTSTLATGSTPAANTVHEEIVHAVRLHGGVRACAAEVAAAYGDYPETAAPRMRWARRVVDTIYATPQERTRLAYPRTLIRRPSTAGLSAAQFRRAA